MIWKNYQPGCGLSYFCLTGEGHAHTQIHTHNTKKERGCLSRHTSITVPLLDKNDEKEKCSRIWKERSSYRIRAKAALQ